MIATFNPEMAEQIKSSDPQRAVDAIDDAIEELLKELPEGSRTTKPKAPSWKKYQ